MADPIVSPRYWRGDAAVPNRQGILSRARTAPEPTLPEGFDVEPQGWRDDDDLTPIDAMRNYVADLYEFERWAASEDRKTSTYGRGGQLTTEDEAIHRRLSLAFNRLREKHLSPKALTRARGLGYSYANPCDFDPKAQRVMTIERSRAGLVRITVQRRRPELPADVANETIRYDVVKRAGRWRIDNRLGLWSGERSIGGLF